MFFKSKPTVAEQLPKALDSLWRFAFRLTGNQQDAEELVQKTALRALEKQHLYNSDLRFISWLFSIAHSTWKNDIRSRKIHESSRINLDYAELKIDNLSPKKLNEAENQLMLNSVLKYVNSLPEAQRTPILLVYVEELSYKEAATILEIPIGTLMSRIARARAKIGQAMNQATSGEHDEKHK